MAVNVEYNAHGIIDTCAIETQIRWYVYMSPDMQNCNYAGFVKNESWYNRSKLLMFRYIWLQALSRTRFV